nr:MAG TPA: hypothetical protein [Caudoviricetes sp.]
MGRGNSIDVRLPPPIVLGNKSTNRFRPGYYH